VAGSAEPGDDADVCASHQPPGEQSCLRRTLTAILLAGALFVLLACGGNASSDISAGGASPTSSVAKQKLAKTRFVANAGLAAGATYQWIVKPYRNGKFKKGANGRTVALVKAGLAGTFAYNRLKHAMNNAKGDPTGFGRLGRTPSGGRG
jgi:hypothetical protein